MIFAGPATAPTGIPPPIIFPSMIRSGAMPMLSATGAETESEPGYNFVTNQKRAVVVRDFGERFQRSGVRIHDAHVGGDRLDDHGGDFFRRGAE